MFTILWNITWRKSWRTDLVATLMAGHNKSTERRKKEHTQRYINQYVCNIANCINISIYVGTPQLRVSASRSSTLNKYMRYEHLCLKTSFCFSLGLNLRLVEMNFSYILVYAIAKWALGAVRRASHMHLLNRLVFSCYTHFINVCTSISAFCNCIANARQSKNI